jgi:hypothetical protein
MDGFITIFLFTDAADSILNHFKGNIPAGTNALLMGACALVVAVLFLRRRKNLFLKFIVAGLFLTWWGTSWSSNWSQDYTRFEQEYKHLQEIYANQQYQIAEGNVHVLHAQPAEGHAKGDVITVGGVEFEINAFLVTFGYNQTISHGGVLTEGTNARIYYFRDENLPDRPTTILRIDLANHAGAGSGP